ncbi:hypothetical protein [Nonomuraea sp. NPDC046570]|uniref:hypothetical protein n=1 Tax=Nonomuraea sp. NPDC046570 TaxID=3155255 RepID=UPI0033FF3B3D
MLPGGVAVPASTTFPKEAGGGLVVVAERVGDYGGSHLQELLPDRSTASGRWDADLVEEGGQMVGAAGLACSAAREQPARGAVGGGVHVVASRNIVQQQGCDRLGDGRGRFPEAQEHVFSVTQQVIDGEPNDPGKGLCVEEHDDADDPQTLGNVSIDQQTPEGGQALVLCQRRSRRVSTAKPRAWPTRTTRARVTRPRPPTKQTAQVPDAVTSHYARLLDDSGIMALIDAELGPRPGPAGMSIRAALIC